MAALPSTGHQCLNVFPVPDGDTGTNMLLTMQGAWHEIEHSPEENVGKVTQLVAHGALMGARGNSGVISRSCGADLRAP